MMLPVEWVAVVLVWEWRRMVDSKLKRCGVLMSGPGELNDAVMEG